MPFTGTIRAATPSLIRPEPLMDFGSAASGRQSGLKPLSTTTLPFHPQRSWRKRAQALEAHKAASTFSKYLSALLAERSYQAPPHS